MPPVVTSDELYQAAEQALARLTDGCTTADQIAARLRAHDCTGDITACSTCPVANWVEKQLTEAGFPEPGATVSCVCIGVHSLGTTAFTYTRLGTPALIAEFILAFDDGAYPHLATDPHIAQEIADEH